MKIKKNIMVGCLIVGMAGAMIGCESEKTVPGNSQISKLAGNMVEQRGDDIVFKENSTMQLSINKDIDEIEKRLMDNGFKKTMESSAIQKFEEDKNGIHITLGDNQNDDELTEVNIQFGSSTLDEAKELIKKISK